MTAVGAVGTILSTDNGGESWVKHATRSSATLFDVAFHDGGMGWAVGNLGAMFHTRDGGLNWEDRTFPCLGSCTKPKDLIQIRFTDDKTGWIVGERGVVYRTEDAGFHWVQYPGEANVSLYGLSFPDASRGWASGERGTILQVTPPTRSR